MEISLLLGSNVLLLLLLGLLPFDEVLCLLSKLLEGQYFVVLFVILEVFESEDRRLILAVAGRVATEHVDVGEFVEAVHDLAGLFLDDG